ncbi:GNAT family N-acetyltransferase [Promethearchaeum syntrophicum]|uniref:GNAT family N-acetyltransferase n=1 Tax=Promethearchaeum syntrophicum TaxID=2594042 RepID=A0A5B9D5H9_9ARCH|nr:GNAT family N-acetyltransferase [Candidatus Prometheoarchaeum syntrophicum]QEE14246.1 putative acetyltransferase [Candidatus Prometheoarchaeum syntrophicum]
MKIILLDSTTEPIFWDFVGERIEEYFFFIMDYKQDPDSTKIWMAFGEDEKIKGMLLNYKEKNIQIRGSDEAVKNLINQVDMLTMDITVLNSHKEFLNLKDKENKKEILLNRMVIYPGENLISNNLEPEILEESDREEIASLFRKADPEFWGKVKGNELVFSETHKWFGIKRSNQIVSFSQIWIGDEIGIVSTVATDPNFRNQGLATVLVSYAVQELFKHVPLGLIHVRADNTPAVHTYEKIGYKKLYQFSFYKRN